MKLYKITARNEATTWAGSQTEAAKARKEFMELGYKRADLDTQDIDIPTDKVGLLNWLNKNCK